MALFLPRLVKPVVVGIARNPSGGVLSAVAAKALESKLLLTGYDTTMNLTQNGTTVGGNMTYTGRGHTCTVPDSQAQQIINAALAGIPDNSGGFPVSGTASGSNVTLSIGGITFAGTFGASTMDLTGSTIAPGVTQFSMTLKHVR
jgi:hypothetical protein